MYDENQITLCKQKSWIILLKPNILKMKEI